MALFSTNFICIYIYIYSPLLRLNAHIISVCIYIYIYTYIYIYKYIYIYICVFIYIYTHIYIYTYIHILRTNQMQGIAYWPWFVDWFAGFAIVDVPSHPQDFRCVIPDPGKKVSSRTLTHLFLVLGGSRYHKVMRHRRKLSHCGGIKI